MSQLARAGDILVQRSWIAWPAMLGVEQPAACLDDVDEKGVVRDAKSQKTLRVLSAVRLPDH